MAKEIVMDHDEHREVIDLDHPHSFDHSEPNTKFILLIGVGTLITLIVTVVGIQLYFDATMNNEIETVVLAPESQSLRDLHNKEDLELTNYKYIDRQKGVVSLPINRAMELFIKEAAEDRFQYPTKPAPYKTPEQIAAAAAATAAAAAAKAAPAQPGAAAGAK
jgi:hypothetical protein